MTDHEALIAYLATLAAIVIVFLGGALIVATNPALIGETEKLVFAVLLGGLIGALRSPTTRVPTGTTTTGDVNVGEKQ